MSYINPTVAPSGPPPNVLPLIRMGMTVGVLLLGGVIWFLERSGRVAPAPDTGLTTAMPYALGALLAGAIAMRFVVTRAADEQRSTYLIIGWAIGETAALLGGAHWMLTGNPRWYVIGLFVFLSSLVLLPLRRE